MWQPQISLQSPFLRFQIHGSCASSSRIIPRISEVHINGVKVLLENVGQKKTCFQSKSYWIKFLILPKLQAVLLFHSNITRVWGEGVACTPVIKPSSAQFSLGPGRSSSISLSGPASPRSLQRGAAMYWCCLFSSLPVSLPTVTRGLAIFLRDTCILLTVWPRVVLRALTPKWGQVRMTEGGMLGQESETQHLVLDVYLASSPRCLAQILRLQ